MCFMLLKTTTILRDSDIQIFLSWHGWDFLNGAVEGQLLFKKRGISGAWRSGSRKAVMAEDTGHVSKLCVKTLFTSENCHSKFRSFFCVGKTCIILHSHDVVLGYFSKTGVYAGHCFIIHLPGGGHCSLARDSEPIRLFEIPTSPNLYMLFINNNNNNNNSSLFKITQYTNNIQHFYTKNIC